MVLKDAAGQKITEERKAQIAAREFLERERQLKDIETRQEYLEEKAKLKKLKARIMISLDSFFNAPPKCLTCVFYGSGFCFGLICHIAIKCSPVVCTLF